MEITNDKWASRLVKMAHEVASWSKDKSKKVGAVITTKEGLPVSWGFNGMPRKIDDNVPERHERPFKYKWMCHAERNAMDLAPRGDLSDCVMFVTFSPCTNCAQGIIQKGISTVVVDANNTHNQVPEHWREDMAVAAMMLEEAGVEMLSAYPSVDIDD